MTRALIVVVLLVLLLLIASHASASCATSPLAQNASVVLAWTLRTGDETFTRVSHTTEVLATTGSNADRLVILGGIEYESAQPVVTNPLLVYDIQTNVFVKPRDAILSSLTPETTTSQTKRVVDDKFASPASRVDHASFVRAGVVYVFGGQNKAFLNDTWRLCFDSSAATATWDQLVAPIDAVTLAATPVPRIGPSFTQVFENSTTIGAVVVGGVSESYNELDGLHLALITKASAAGGCSTRSPRVVWRMLQATAASAADGVPAPRAYHAAVATSALFSSTKAVCLLIQGGKSTQLSVIFNELWRFCPSSSLPSVPVEQQTYTWELLTPLGTTPGARYGASVVFIDDGRVALAGGSYTFPNDFLSDVWELNVNATQWIRLRFDADFAPPRRGHTLAFVAATSTLWLFGGKDRYTVVQKRIESTRYAAPFCAAGLRIALCDATGEYVCEPCPAGQFLQSGTRNCVPCAQGSLSAAGAAQCTLCPSGTYSTAIGKTNAAPCTPCPVGTASSAVGASVLAACLACSAGTFAATTGSTVCTPCAAGTSSSAGATTCSPCRVGKWSTSGSAACQSCVAGTFSPMTGSAACFACPKGHYSAGGADACLPCPLNTSSSSIGAARAACEPCSSLSYTNLPGQTRCQTCTPGSMLVSGSCQPCTKGSFASEVTAGACVPCPIGTYATASGATACASCPTDTTTLSTGASTRTDCLFCAAGFYLSGTSCVACAPGTFASSAGVCSLCAPGSYAPRAGASGCALCAPMTATSERGNSQCATCPDNTFALTGWRHCVACGLTESQLLGCKRGRNGVMCSGAGRCVFGGCACDDGWTAADCSVRTSSTIATVASVTSAAVLYFPRSPSQRIEAPTSATSTSDVAIVVARSGPTSAVLTALVDWTAHNFSTAMPSGFPMAIALSAGVETQTFRVPLAALTPRTGCRFFTLTLRDTSSNLVVPSAVSTEPDRSITVFVDDMNGVAGSDSASTQTVSTSYDYAPDRSAVATATVTLDRIVASQFTLSPSILTVSGSDDATHSRLLLQHQRLNILVALDRSSDATVVNLLPAAIAQLQMRYTLEPDALRLGLIVGSTSNSAALPTALYYTSTNEFLIAARQLVAPTSAQQMTLTWDWLAAGLTQNASVWPVTGRRFVWVLDFNQLSLVSSASTAALAFLHAARAQSAYCLFIQPPASSPLSRGNTIDMTASVADVMQRVVYDSVGLLPAALLLAHATRDATLPTRVDVLDDAAAVVTSSRVLTFAAGVSSMPVLQVLLTPLPSTSALTSTAMLSIPGLLQLELHIAAPSRACFPPAMTLPADPQLYSGWLDRWTPFVSITEVQQQWRIASTTLEMQIYDDASLLRSVTNAVLSIRDPQQTRMTLTRTLAGADVSARQSLVLHGYMRSPSAGAESVGTTATATASCEQRLSMIASNQTLVVAIAHNSALSSSEWHYGWLERVVPWDVDALSVTLDCNTSAPNVTVEWTTLGLLPDPNTACKCPRGFFNSMRILISSDNETQSNTDSSECVHCPAGSYCAAGIKRQCPDGSFSFGKAATCELCRDGWICVNGLARLCMPGTYATPASVCVVCPAGFACRNGKRASCPPGTFARAQASECASCPPGTIAQVEASPTCERCPLHYTSNHQRNHCVACAPGEQTMHAAQHTCASCLMTTFPPSRSSEQCVA